MIYYHITNKSRLASILKHGLQTRFAKNKKQRYVWVHTEATETMLRKTARRHMWQRQNMVILTIELESNIFTKHPNKNSRTGFVLKTGRDIETKYITNVAFYKHLEGKLTQ